MPLDGLRWSRDSGSALCGVSKPCVLGWAGGGIETPHSVQFLSQVFVKDQDIAEMLFSIPWTHHKFMLHDPYNFDFLTMTEGFKEKELKKALIDNIIRFLISKVYEFVHNLECARRHFAAWHPPLRFYAMV